MGKPVISILIPFRNNGDRQEQFDWLQSRWKALFPEAEVIIESDDNKDPFSKTIAVNRCYARATSDVLAMVDADVWVEPAVLLEAARRIRGGHAAWVQPCNRVVRLNEEYTKELVKTDPTADWNPTIDELKDKAERITPVVGLVAVFSREGFERIGGMDPRFRGWGWEDNAFNNAMNTIHGRVILLQNYVWHLWHPRGLDNSGKPTWVGQQTRNADIGRRYKEARGNRRKMLSLVKEVRSITGIGK